MKKLLATIILSLPLVIYPAALKNAAPHAPAQQSQVPNSGQPSSATAAAAVVAQLDPNCKTCETLTTLETSMPDFSFKPRQHNDFGLVQFLQKHPQQLAPCSKYLSAMDSFKACSHIQAKCTEKKCSLPGTCIRGRAGSYFATYEGHAALSYFMLMTQKEFAQFHGKPTDDIEWSINRLWPESA